MERMNRTKRTKRSLCILMLAGMFGAVTRGADTPATQPAAAPDATATTPAPNNNDAGQSNQLNQNGRGNRRGRNGNRNDSGGNGGGYGGTASTGSTGSTSNPAGLDKYAVLKTRSIFIKGNQIVIPENMNVRPTRLPNDDPRTKKSSMLVFNGVIVMDDEPNALIEDQGSSKVWLLRVGDPLAAGRLSSVTFDDITYEANGTEKKIFMGQNMDGETPTVAEALPPAPPSTQPGTASVTGGTPAAPAAGGENDTLAKMRAKRAAELGIKQQ